jgi:glycerol-3-phosphate cytidylyltransferase
MIRGFTCGVFDLFHPGHALMLEECKLNCDYLVLGLNSCKTLAKEKNEPIFTFNERKIILESNKHIDEIIEYSGELELIKILKKNKFQVRFLGEDYFDKPITGLQYTEKVHFCYRGHGYSTSKLRDKIKNI